VGWVAQHHYCGPQESLWLCRTIAKGALQALSFCHERGVAHGSLGSASILLSTFDDRKARDLIVKLDNFGFARMQQSPGTSGVWPCLFTFSSLSRVLHNLASSKCQQDSGTFLHPCKYFLPPCRTGCLAIWTYGRMTLPSGKYVTVVKV
jgi:serine/threonine protein kinase